MSTPNSGYAQVFNIDTSGIDQIADAVRRRQIHEQQQKDKLRLKQQAYTQYVGDVFDNKNFATGTVYDPIIQKQIDESKSKYLGLLQKNPNADLADIAFQMQQDAGRIGGMSSKVKAARAKITEQFADMDPKQWNKSEAINLALHDALYADDGTGKKVLKADPDEINLDIDYRRHVQDNYFDVVSNVSDGEVMKGFLSEYKYDAVSGIYDRTNQKERVREKYSGNMYNGLQDVYDDGKSQPVLKTKTRKLITGKDDKGAETSIDILDDGIYKSFSSDPIRNSWLNSQMKKFGANIETNSPEAELIKRQIVKGGIDQMSDKLNYEYVEKERQAPNWVIYGTPPTKERKGSVDWKSTVGNLPTEGNKINISQPLSTYKLGAGDILGPKYVKSATYDKTTGNINVDGQDYTIDQFRALTRTLNSGDNEFDSFFDALKNQKTEQPKQDGVVKPRFWNKGKRIFFQNGKDPKTRADIDNKNTKAELD